MSIDDVFEDAHNNFIADIKVDFSNEKESSLERDLNGPHNEKRQSL